MTKPLVSIVVISYNQGKYINQVLDSLKEQTYSDWQLIVADDASPDDSITVFENWLEKNIIAAKKIYHTKNTGLPTVLNEAIELCEGKYVKFIAADDYMHPECLEKSVNCLEEKGNSFGMVFSDTYFVDETGNFAPVLADYNVLGDISPEDFRRELLMRNRIAALTVLMRTSVVKETGQYDSKFIIEDYYRWLKINEKYWIAYIPEKLTYYRWHDSNISKIKSDRIEIETRLLQLMFTKSKTLKSKVNHFLLSRFFHQKNLKDEMFTINRNRPFTFNQILFYLKYQLTLIGFKLNSK